MDKFDKQPSEKLDYDCVFSGDGLTDGDYLNSIVSVVADDAGITIDSYSLNATTHILKVWVSGGASGHTYKITVLGDTAFGRRLEGDFKIKVKEL